MTTFLILTGLVFLYGIATLAVAIWNSPEGVQDEKGFHVVNGSSNGVEKLYHSGNLPNARQAGGIL
jgi:hypothetical protein